MAKLLITRPEHDDTTHYLSNWSKDIINKASSKNLQILDLNRERANRKEVENMIAKQKPELIIFNGHGDYETISGHKNEKIISVNDNEDILNSSITYSIACKSAKFLGPKSVKSGAKAYIGYDEDFIFVYEPEMISRPLKDKTAELFLGPSNELINSLIKGNKTGEACRRSRELFKKNFNKLLSSEASEEDASIARYIWWDMKHQVCCGDNESSL